MQINHTIVSFSLLIIIKYMIIRLFSAILYLQFVSSPLSICNRFSVFSSGFPDIPRKISAYLQTESSSNANTRIMKGLYKTLNINDLCLKDISSLRKKHHIGLRNGLYWELKSTISHAEMGLIGLRNGQYQKAEWIISDYCMGYIIYRYVPKRAS